MDRTVVKNVLRYYAAIPGMRKVLREELDVLEEEYNSLHGVASDSMPHGSTPGRGAEARGIQAAENNVALHISQRRQKDAELQADYSAIGGCLDRLNGGYKRVIILRFVRGYSWGRISVQMKTPDSTVRYWCDQALDRLKEPLYRLPDSGGIISRARDART